MDIRYVKNKNIDKTKWDYCIEHSFNGTLYAMSWYLDVASDYWDALVVGDYETVFPITYTKKFGFKILRQPVSSQQLGIFSKEPLSQDEMIAFLEAIPKSFLFGDLHLNAGNKISSTKKFSVKYNVNIELDVRGSIDEVKKNYSSSIVRNLKRTSKQEIILKEGSDYKRIIDTFRNTKGKDFQVHPNYYKTAYKVFGALAEKNNFIIFDAFDDSEKFLAGLILAPFKNKMYILFAGSTPEAYKVYANYLLYDKAIEIASETKEILDFEGSNTESLAFVYHGFGGETVPYPVVTITNVPSVFEKMFHFLKKMKG